MPLRWASSHHRSTTLTTTPQELRLEGIRAPLLVKGAMRGQRWEEIIARHKIWTAHRTIGRKNDDALTERAFRSTVCT